MAEKRRRQNREYEERARRSRSSGGKRKRKKKRKTRRMRRVLFLFMEILILCILLGIGYVMAKYEKIQKNSFGEKDIAVNEGVDINRDGYTTVALFGGDSREGVLEEGTHADTIMVASINGKTKEIRMVSLYRDTLTRQADGEMKKANYAYFKGGPKAAINMLNQNYDLNIQNYVTVDFKALTDTIDLLGGIEADVSEEEMYAMNEYIGETAMVAGKDANLLTASGVQTLDGVQATTYARIRKNVGGDYKRTERQRFILQQVAEKAKNTDIVTLNRIINKVFPQISTNFSLKDIITLAADMIQFQLGETSGFPFELTDGNVESVGSSVIPLGLVENVQELHQFLYSEEAYEPSGTIGDIASQLEEMTGYTREDYHGTAQTTENNE